MGAINSNSGRNTCRKSAKSIRLLSIQIPPPQSFLKIGIGIEQQQHQQRQRQLPNYGQENRAASVLYCRKKFHSVN
ncbi:hypothetical protein TYRP_009722 [Tyrophagus putrescentiae]|nr:hypothetical protein TYRP_009722 [Tyrophagus putrescentiae]